MEKLFRRIPRSPRRLCCLLLMGWLLMGSYSASAQALGCISPNISVGTNCGITKAELDDLIVSDPAGSGNYLITISKNGNLLWTGDAPTDVFDASNCIGQMVSIDVTDLTSGNSCEVDVLVEDKFAPILTCISDTISCADNAATQINNRPTATDNCCTDVQINIDFENLTQLSNFVGPFAPDNWQEDVNLAEGEAFDFPDANSLILTGANNTGGNLSCGNPSSASPRPIVNPTLASCYTAEVCIDIPTAGTLSFNWLLAAGGSNLFGNSDPAAYSVTSNSVTTYTQLSSSTLTSGSISGLTLAAGDQFCFLIGSNGSAENSQVTYSNFAFVPTVDNCAEYCFYRLWTATDCHNNTSECYQKVLVEQKDLDDVVFPSDTVLTCDNISGVPGPDISGRPTIDGNNADDVCMINVFPYEDMIDTICENSFKIIRTWTVMDWCLNDSNIVTTRQIIKVLDTLPPTFSCPNDTIISTDAQNCTASLVLPGLSNLTDNCSSSANITAIPSCSGCTITQVLNNYVISNLSLGTTTVTYTVSDNCGNSGTCTFDITVRDEIPPSVQGSRALVATLQIDGVGRVVASTFDNGSYDNCSPNVWFKAIRQVDLNGSVHGSTADQSSNTCASNNGDDDPIALVGTQIYFDDSVSFCCMDVGSTRDSVVLRVFDVDPGSGPIAPSRMDQGFLEDLSGNRIGNFSDVMVPVEVQDQQSPLVLNDLPDITISCNFSYDPSNLSASFGKVVTSIAAQENITINDAENNVNTPQPFTWGQDALVTDNCGDNLIISYDSTFNLDATCNTGTISRTITVSSGSGTPAIITQTITIQDFDPFNPAEDAVWMGNMDLYLTATDCNFDVGSLGAPTITNDNCSKAVPAIAEELVFNRPTAQLGAGMCLKILRKWEIRDWCQPDSAWCNPNLLNGEQTIIVWDTFPATFAFDRPDCDTITITSGATTANYAATATITDNCTNVFDATNVSYTITPGGVLTGGTGTSINADLPFGVHEVVFTAVDDCGTSATDTLKVVVINDPCTFVNQFNAVNFGSDPINVAVTDVYTGGIVGATLDISGIGSGASVTFNCTDIQYNTQYPTTYNGNVNIPAFGGAPAAQCPTSFIVQDLDPPTLVCNPPASFELDANNQAVITINDMVPTANDNCDTSNLIFSFQELDFSAPNDPLNPPANLAKLDTMIDCSDLSVDGTVQVNLWVYDLTGKGIQCDPFLSFTNGPNSDCANAKPSTIPAVITGQILDEENGQVENVVVSMNGDRISSSVTQTDGTFRFSDVPTGFNYSIEPAKDDKPLNGVSTYDLVQISKHVLELEKLNSPYKMIAADANRNGEITAIDLVEIRKLILFVDRDFQENTSWRFIDADYLFPNSDDPFTGTFPEVYNINDLQRDMRINFVAVKVGDVNCSANPNEVIGSEDRHAVGDLVFQLPDLEITAGQTYEVPFHLSKDAELFGYQYTLEFDQEALEFDDIQAGTLPGLSKGNFGLQLLEQGAITTSWSTTQAIKGEKLGELFRIRFRAKRSGQLSDFLTAGSRFTTAEGYNAEGDLLNIALQFDEQQVETADSRFLLYQNRPNPFRAETLIGFHLPQSSVAELTVFDLSGKLILRKERLFKKGFNEFSINQSELQQAGVLYYQLKTDRHTAVKKMTVLE